MQSVAAIGHEQVLALLPMVECIDLVASALEALERGDADMPLRFGYQLPLENKVGILASMPAYMKDSSGEYCANKVITVFPTNKQAGGHSHQGAVLLFEARHGRLLALVDAAELTAVRTAAASAVATRLLAREDSAVLAILGSGAQARTHLEAMLLVRPGLRALRCWSRTRASAEAFSAWARTTHPALEVEARNHRTNCMRSRARDRASVPGR
jgi:ornithine cyclodeaminase